ncbi:MAG: phosphate signaling complex protein PhoU [Clostridia bacterium]|nr:phosphate signaling complex protein PhoU [Eubacteriales bacterium]MDD4462319.1 phosphate signaling complex protein PhoU [Eubacteriales bacterium]NCC48888.1 phosphate signaling complex protein PhoU [Clostridia bacterium]
MVTRIEFERDMSLLHEEIMRMGAQVESAIEEAINALIELDTERAQKVIDQDDIVDEMERRIDRHCVEIIARQQPVARDLRDVTSTLKLITDLERIADHASDISERVLDMAGNPDRIPVPHDIVTITKLARQMLHGSLDAYVEKNQRMAHEVISMDNKVDDLYLRIKAYLTRMMTVDPANVPQLVELLLVCKYAERIADHAQNVAEWVIYYIEGRLKDEA